MIFIITKVLKNIIEVKKIVLVVKVLRKGLGIRKDPTLDIGKLIGLLNVMQLLDDVQFRSYGFT